MPHADGGIPPGETRHTTIQFYTGPLVQDEGKPLEVIDPSTVSNPDRAAPRAAIAPHRSSAEPSPPTPLGNPPGSVICNWQRSDILIGRLHPTLTKRFESL